jgi:hypothetical protein
VNPSVQETHRKKKKKKKKERNAMQSLKENIALPGP